MKVKREWQDEPDLFEAVSVALTLAEEEDSEISSIARDEEGSYGDHGTITIKKGGREFQIDLHEIII